MVKNKTTLLQGLWLVALLAVLTLASCQNRKPQAADSARQENVKVVSELTAASFVDKVFDYTQPVDSVVKLAGKLPVIVDFYATWCGPCRRMAPELEAIARKYAGKIAVYKVDVDKEQDLAMAFEVQSIPTLLLINAEGRVEMLQGGLTRSQLQQVVDVFLLPEAKTDSVAGA